MPNLKKKKKETKKWWGEKMLMKNENLEDSVKNNLISKLKLNQPPTLPYKNNWN